VIPSLGRFLTIDAADIVFIFLTESFQGFQQPSLIIPIDRRQSRRKSMRDSRVPLLVDRVWRQVFLDALYFHIFNMKMQPTSHDASALLGSY
jgi:hypothetical protein